MNEVEKPFREAVAVDRNFSEAHGGLASALAMQVRVDGWPALPTRSFRITSCSK